MAVPFRGFEKKFSDQGLWNKLFKYAKTAGSEVVEKVLWLYYAAQDPQTPAWAKTTIYGALGYFIFPFDVIPDFLAGFGYTDDLSVLIAAVATVSAYITEDVKHRTRLKMTQWFGPDPNLTKPLDPGDAP